MASSAIPDFLKLARMLADSGLSISTGLMGVIVWPRGRGNMHGRANSNEVIWTDKTWFQLLTRVSASLKAMPLMRC